MLTDIEIARNATPLPITEVAARLGYSPEDIEPYGKFKAKVPLPSDGGNAKLILVTAMNPTPLGEGKTTVSIGLADGMRRLGLNSCLALREPSLGPVFGIKGGACGGGYAQVIPMEDINLHFTGDFHAVTSANDLLSALIDNHIKFGNALGIKEVIWRRCLDLNDRALRTVEVGLGGIANGVPREDGFVITAASEIMAVLCLASSLADLKRRLGNIVIGYDGEGRAIRARDLKAEGAMTVLLRDALRPNLVQTLEGTPAFVHGGPFANIAHGCNSILATRRRKISRHQMPQGGAHPLLRSAGGHRAQSQIQRRSAERGRLPRKRRRAQNRLRQRETALEQSETVRSTRRCGNKSLFCRYGRRA